MTSDEAGEMTLEEAIEYLRKQLAVRLGSRNLSVAIQQGDKIAHSIQLGIEALKRCKELESPSNYSPMRPLPGETKGVT